LIRTRPLLAAAAIAKLATFLALTLLTALTVVVFFKEEVLSLLFVVTFSLPSLMEKLFFFFSVICGIASS